MKNLKKGGLVFARLLSVFVIVFAVSTFTDDTIPTDYGKLIIRPAVTITATAFDRSGNPYPFSGAGMGVMFMRDTKIKSKLVTIGAGANWLAFNVKSRVGSGPALLVGLENVLIGPAYDVKNKEWYALTTYSIPF